VSGKSPIQCFSTQNAPPGEEIEYWHDHVCDKILELNFHPLDKRHFHGEFTATRIGDLTMGNFYVGPIMTERRATSIHNAGSTSSMLCFALTGSIESTLGGAHLRLEPGAGAIYRDSLPYTVANREPNRVLTLQIPEAMIAGGTSVLERVAHRDLAQCSKLFPLVKAYVMQLARLNTSLDANTAGRIGRNLADLVNAMAAEVVLQSPVHLSEYKIAALMRVCMFVEEHLADPGLSPQMVACALRLTPRYVNKLLEAEGTSLGRLILRRRLDRTAADLRDSALAMRNISTIAMAHGFIDQSYFSKVFRQRYGMSPREYRQSESSLSSLDVAIAECRRGGQFRPAGLRAPDN